MKARNKYSVSKKEWSKLRESQRMMFNAVIDNVCTLGQDLFLHPKTIKRGLEQDEFMTIAWNAALVAANNLYGKRV